MSKRVLAGALLMALVAPAGVFAGDNDLVTNLQSARTALSTSAASRAQIEGLADSASLTGNAEARRQLQFIALQLSTGRLDDAGAALDQLIDAERNGHGGNHPGNPGNHPGNPGNHPGNPGNPWHPGNPHPGNPGNPGNPWHPGHPGFPPGHPGWDHDGHHWHQPPHWWHPIPTPILIPIGIITYNEGYNYGYQLGHYDGWDNFPYNTSQDPYFYARPIPFQQGYMAGYRLGYQRGQMGQ